ncbi:hypothetical protein PoB_005892300 [Plakobranchus ocellatus]|uniref:Uncharacterized protein n=1 Tax=Plakobranchus ocellatus TaxID=259542 RepID=A0AAV4CL34_9GAST|nr:hypothetical protein PoB_005892300 [Plakobranchus ocellatus]
MPSQELRDNGFGVDEEKRIMVGWTRISKFSLSSSGGRFKFTAKGQLDILKRQKRPRLPSPQQFVISGFQAFRQAVAPGRGVRTRDRRGSCRSQ